MDNADIWWPGSAPWEGNVGRGEIDPTGAGLSGPDAVEVAAEGLQAGHNQDTLLSDRLKYSDAGMLMQLVWCHLYITAITLDPLWFHRTAFSHLLQENLETGPGLTSTSPHNTSRSNQPLTRTIAQGGRHLSCQCKTTQRGRDGAAEGSKKAADKDTSSSGQSGHLQIDLRSIQFCSNSTYKRGHGPREYKYIERPQQSLYMIPPFWSVKMTLSFKWLGNSSATPQ